jgi:predicted amidohydrolase YtcJ
VVRRLRLLRDPVAARYGLWASIARQTAKGTFGPQPFGTAEAVDIHTALRSYTAWSARQMFLEDKIGTLEVGKKGDIAVWTATSTLSQRTKSKI